MAFREDASRIRTGHGPQPVDPAPGDTAKGSLATRYKQTDWNDGYLLKVLSNWNAIVLPVPLHTQG